MNTEQSHFTSECWWFIYVPALLIPPLVAEWLQENESVRDIVTCYANRRAGFYRTIMRINPEHYTTLCVQWKCRGFPLLFAIVAYSPLGWVDPP